MNSAQTRRAGPPRDDRPAKLPQARPASRAQPCRAGRPVMAGWRRLALAGVLLASASASAAAQPAPPRKTVIQPPANIDPKMPVAPKTTAALPTPVIHPPARRDGTIIVPK